MAFLSPSLTLASSVLGFTQQEHECCVFMKKLVMEEMQMTPESQTDISGVLTPVQRAGILTS